MPDLEHACPFVDDYKHRSKAKACKHVKTNGLIPLDSISDSRNGFKRQGSLQLFLSFTARIERNASCYHSSRKVLGRGAKQGL